MLSIIDLRKKENLNWTKQESTGQSIKSESANKIATGASLIYNH